MPPAGGGAERSNSVDSIARSVFGLAARAHLVLGVSRFEQGERGQGGPAVLGFQIGTELIRSGTVSEIAAVGDGA